MKTLTKAEEQVMHILWDIKKGFVNDVINQIPEPKPAYNTVSTIIRILETKGFIGHKPYGKTHEYFPIITKEEYSSKTLNNFISNYFDNSYKDLVSFFSKQENISVKELEEIKKIIEEELKNKEL
ncbi:MAG: BlaI/MecI/CopY family transcriptional regulator [Bacteroidales bacterium]|jgi:predicted transcriptional regulator|nr:BlaI/MecI/CopY family transcriptional regulator [Bacteroidales bacterium]